MLFSFLFSVLANEIASPPIDPEELRTWWGDAGGLYIGKTSYRVQETKFSEGVCAFRLNGGVLTPVFSGDGIVEQQMVGFVYTGSGTISMRFPQRSDAWSFGNHMSKRAKLERNELLPIAVQKKSYTVPIDRGIFLSANPAIQNLRNELQPIGKGLRYTYDESGSIVSTLVSNEDKYKGLEKANISTIFRDRSKNLERVGINIRSLIRQDRLMYEHLNLPKSYLRSIADFRTTQRFYVAGQEGGVIDSMSYDKWLTCVKDARDEFNTGYRSLAFAQGKDADKRSHFQRFSGELLNKKDSSKAVSPHTGMDSVYANSTIHITPVRGGADQKVSVESKLTLKAKGGDVQYVTLQLPTQGARFGTWELEALELEDGRLLSWAGLNADLSSAHTATKRLGGQRDSLSNKETERLQANQQLTTNSSMNQTQSSTSASSENSSQGSVGDAESIQAEDPFAATQLSMTEQDTAAQERNVFQESGFTYKIVVVLPEVISKDESVQILLRWSASFPYANMRTTETSEGVVVRSAGSSTGLISYLPTLIPASGGSMWKFYTKIGTPAKKGLFRTQSIVASGKTQKKWEEEDSWEWIAVEGKKGIHPSVALGKWKDHQEKGTQSIPAIRVNVFPKNASKRKQFPAEVRRVISFLEEFLPKFPAKEIEILEESSESLTQERTKPGIITLRSYSITAVGQSGKKRDGNRFITQEQIAAQIAGQYWGQTLFPSSSRDEWFMDSIPNAYANFYIRAIHGLEEYTKKIDRLRKKIENPKSESNSWKSTDSKNRAFSLSGSTLLTDVPLHLRQDYGFYVFAEMLRLRVGNHAFFSALDNAVKLPQRDRISTEEIQSKLERESKQKLSNFFDFWIHGGHIPSLTIRTRVDTKEGMSVLFGCIESDVPYGIFDVPVRIVLPNKSIDTFIKMVHGYGSLTIPNADSSTAIELDPLGLIVAYKRKSVQTTKETSCSTDPMRK